MYTYIYIYIYIYSRCASPARLSPGRSVLELQPVNADPYLISRPLYEPQPNNVAKRALGEALLTLALPGGQSILSTRSRSELQRFFFKRATALRKDIYIYIYI